MSSNQPTQSGRSIIEKDLLKYLVSFGIVFGLGLITIFLGFLYFDTSMEGWKIIVNIGVILVGSILVMVSFGGTYRLLHPDV